MKQQIHIHGNFNYLAYSVRINQVYRVDNQLIVIAGVEDNHMELASASEPEICQEFMRRDTIVVDNSVTNELPIKLYLILPEGCEFVTDQTITTINRSEEIGELNDPESIPMLLKIIRTEKMPGFFGPGANRDKEESSNNNKNTIK